MSATTLLPEQPKPRRPMTIMVVPKRRFSVGMAFAGLAQFREREIRNPKVSDCFVPTYLVGFIYRRLH